MIRSLLVGTALLGLTALALAQSDPIAARKALMKANGAATGLGTRFVKGEAPFELARAQEIFDTYVKAAATMPTLFPDNSKTGGETTASPKVWEDMAGFRARFEAFGKDATAAKAKVTDLETFKTEFATVTRNCGGCHQTFRVRT